MSKQNEASRRGFLKGVGGATALIGGQADAQEQIASQRAATAGSATSAQTQHSAPIQYPRVYSGEHLKEIAFPLGGIGTGSISLGGRGQLRDWEIYNRPDKGRSPAYAFASIWAKSGSSKPVAKVLEARLSPPYASTAGLGPGNAPGLSRLESATFTGEYPLAHIEFHDRELPVQVSLEAFSPFIPLDADNSGFPVAVLRYRVKNPNRTPVSASIAFSLENPTGDSISGSAEKKADKRVAEFKTGNNEQVQGLYMTNPSMAENDPQRGSFALTVLNAGDGNLTYLRGWPAAKWWASPMKFWDDFSSDGKLGPEADNRKVTGSICLQRELNPGQSKDFTFLLSWHFPNRTPKWSGWTAPKGHENDVIGNHYCTRFDNAWTAALEVAKNLPELEQRTKRFAETMRASTLPGSVRDAAMSNLSTLVTQTSFRTADGEFHGFEGCNDHQGCCFGNCTHVWNYETTTQYVFPKLARSLRKASFGFSQDEQGGMRFRQQLPDGIDRWNLAAADGQMGQIIKAYMDWKLCGDTEWLRGHWQNIKRGISFAWIEGGWDPNRDGVMEGVQHNTYDVEFWGPNPMCGIYYLGALRAGEEMARALGDSAAGGEYRSLFEKGRAWIDANLFNGEYYIQKVRSIPKNQIARSTIGDMGAENNESPEFQLGEGCLADQLIGQYLADLAGLGPLVNPNNITKTLQSIQKYNYRENLFDHDSVQRIYALNDEASILICDYGKVDRPAIPFPYYAEAWTGIEYLVAAQFIHAGMIPQGLAAIENVRKRYDGRRRNPWDEPECGHHYARAMSAWSNVIALSGFDYTGSSRTLALRPRLRQQKLTSFWSTDSGWGSFTIDRTKGQPRLEMSTVEGNLALKTLHVNASAGGRSNATINGKKLAVAAERRSGETVLTFEQEASLPAGAVLTISL